MKKVWYKIEGVQNAVKNMNKKLLAAEAATMEQLLAGAEYIKKDMGVTPPLIPEDSGDLDKSWQAKPFKLVKTHPVVEAGFNIKYATWVHERVPGAPWGAGTVGVINWTKHLSGPKFLELALERNRTVVVDMMAVATKKVIETV